MKLLFHQCLHTILLHSIVSMSDTNFKIDDTVNIFSIDDVKMKTLAKIISNKSSIEILNLLFYHEMTANEIAQKTNMSLQLVKYYLKKCIKLI